MTSDQDTKVVAEPQVQQVQEVKDSSHLVTESQMSAIPYLIRNGINYLR
uniref:Uncharacterized protein n=1 Tax=Gopherus agassizii TaxID=38772 RepID=A0A452H4D2_9SAUR